MRENVWTVVGQDGGQSIDLGGSALFVFSDTLVAFTAELEKLLAERRFTSDSARFRANCAAVSSAAALVPALADLAFFKDQNGWPREILAATPKERLFGERFWPGHGILIDDQLYLFYTGIRQIETLKTWGFQVTGSGLAILDPLTGDCRRLSFGQGWAIWTGGTHFGVQVLREDDTVYVFGTRREGVFRSAILARVAPGDIAEPRAYQYLASPEPVWTGDVTAATPLTSCDSEYSVSFNPFLNRYLMTYVDGYEKALYIRTAPKPWGPYTERQLLGRLPHRDQSEMISLGFEHPKFSQEGGRTAVVSYCQPHFTQNSLVAVTFG